MKRTRKRNRINAYQAQKIAIQTYASDSFLAINKKILKKVGLENAVFLCNLIDKFRYFDAKNKLQEDNSFFLTHEDQMEHTGLSEYRIKECKKYFVELGILKTEMKWMPAKEFYWLDFERMVNCFIFDECIEHRSIELQSGENTGSSPHESAGSSPHESAGSKRRLNKKTKDNNITISKNKKNKNSRNKNIKFLPFAEQLAAIIKKEKNINILPSKITNWSNEIRKLYEIDGVSIERIKSALNWYKDSIGGQYIPVIESGNSFRKKFTRLEDAMKRAGITPSSNLPNLWGSESPSIPPKQIIARHFNNNDILTKSFYKNCYIPAKRLVDPEDSRVEEELAKKLIQFLKQIEKKQRETFTCNKGLRELLPGSVIIVEHYLDWLYDNDWIQDVSPKVFDVRTTLFGKYRREEASRDNYERDPLTGKSYWRD